jgi:competence protein ComEA
LGAVVFLSWLGARSAQSTSPPVGEPEAELASLVTMSPVEAAGELPAAQAPGSESAASAEPGDPEASDRAAGVLPDGRIVLNAATAEDLCRLPGIGTARAAKIIELRKKLGGFRSFRQLLRVRGIGPRTLKRLSPLMVLDAPIAPETKNGG